MRKFTFHPFLPLLAFFFLLFSCAETTTQQNQEEKEKITEKRESDFVQPDAPEEGWADFDGLKVPQGFGIEVYAENVENARAMALGNEGTLFVGSRNAGKLVALVDADKDGKAEEQILISDDLDTPSGLAFWEGDLYVSEISRILRFREIESNLNAPPAPEVVIDDLPTERHHGWKYLAFGPEGKLYVPVGAPCNICLSEEDKRFASICRLDADGENFEVVAHGVRNSVGFDFHPESGDLWFTDNGRDMMGDNLPPDELNHLSAPGQHFGYPFCHGGEYLDDEFGSMGDCAKYREPAQQLGPHVAALGMKFYDGNSFPERYHGNIFIAEHGSWNRSTPIGYRVTRIVLDGERVSKYEIFAEGWLQDGDVSGRPADVLVHTDGSLLISDDYGNKIYRIYWSGEN